MQGPRDWIQPQEECLKVFDSLNFYQRTPISANKYVYLSIFWLKIEICLKRILECLILGQEGLRQLHDKTTHSCKKIIEKLENMINILGIGIRLLFQLQLSPNHS